MTLTLRAGETQRAFVERVLRTEGRISAHEAMFGLTDEGGRARSITRLAAIIETLRKAGWEIETRAAHGQQAVYVMRDADAPAYVRGWRCETCRSLPATEPTELLGGLGQAFCATCQGRRYFRRRAA